MGAFFRGWRRKLGVVTLVMACVFAAGWVRSCETVDEFVVLNETWDIYFVRSEGQMLTILHQKIFEAGTNLRFDNVLSVPYWSLVLPLTLLSAYLLLSKPRSPKPPLAS